MISSNVSVLRYACVYCIACLLVARSVLHPTHRRYRDFIIAARSAAALVELPIARVRVRASSRRTA